MGKDLHTGDYIHDVALKSLLQSGEYKTETREWSKFPDDQQTRMAWKTTFREAYGENQRAEVAREEEVKPFGRSAGNDTHEQLRRRQHITHAVPAPLPNHMLVSLEVYLDNIAAAAKKYVTKGGPLGISIDTVTRQKQEIMRLCEHINNMKKRGTKASNI